MSTKKYPYTIFNTYKNISLKDIESSGNIIKLISLATYSNRNSIFDLYKNEIDDIITKDKLNSKMRDDDNILMKKLSNQFDEEFLNKNKIYIFSKEFYYYKYLFKIVKKNINDFLLIMKKNNNEKNILTKNILTKNIKNIIYINPNKIVNIVNLNELNNDRLKKLIINDNVELSINNIYLGHKFNIGLPSIGPIYTVFGSSKYNIIEYIFNLIRYDKDNNYSNQIPLKKLNISETLANILLKKNKRNDLWNISNNNNISNNSKNNNFFDIINKYFKGVDINIDDVISHEKKIKKKFIIPYDIEIIKSDNIDFIIKENNSLSYSISDIKNFFDNNNNLVLIILNKLYEKPIYDEEYVNKILNKKYVKEVLTCYIFYIINLFYDSYKKYIDELNNIIIDMSSNGDIRFKNLNFKDGFNYIEKLNKSLYNFKLILLNDFYNMFLPSKINNNNYGMKLNDNGYYILESKILIDNNFLFNNYPFHIDLINNDIGKTKLINFIINNTNEYDIYNKIEDLSIGVYSINDKITYDTLNVLNKFYSIENIINDFNLYLMDILEKNFKEKIPIELIRDIVDFLQTVTITKNIDKIKIQNFFIDYFGKNKINSASYYIKVLNIEKELKKSKVFENNELYKQKDCYIMASHLYNLKAEIIKIITNNIGFSDNIKNDIHKEYNKIINDINIRVLNVYNSIQEEIIMNSKSNNDNHNETKRIYYSKYWEEFKKIMKNKKILLPILSETNNIDFIDIIQYAIDGEYSDKILEKIPNEINKNFINKSILNKYYILFGLNKKNIENGNLKLIKNEFITKLKAIDKPSMVRKIIHSLINETGIYNKYSEPLMISTSLYKLIMNIININSKKINEFIITQNQIKKILELIK